jgi:hypothetical protein
MSERPEEQENKQASATEEEKPADEEQSGDGEPTAEELERREGGKQEIDDSLPFENQTDRMESESKPFLGGETKATPAGPLPALSLVAIGAFIAIFTGAFFGLWTAVGGALGVFVGIVAGTALAFGVLKVLADHKRS